MADEEEISQQEPEAEADYSPDASAGRRRLVRVGMFVALGLAGLALIWGVSYYLAREVQDVAYRETESIAVVRPPAPTENFVFADDFRINTSDQDEVHFVKMQVSLGFEPGNAALSAELAQRAPQLRNLINLVVSRKERDDLLGLDGRLKLAEEIKASVNHVLSEGRVSEVYFLEFIVN